MFRAPIFWITQYIDWSSLKKKISNKLSENNIKKDGLVYSGTNYEWFDIIRRDGIAPSTRECQNDKERLLKTLIGVNKENRFITVEDIIEGQEAKDIFEQNEYSNSLTRSLGQYDKAGIIVYSGHHLQQSFPGIFIFKDRTIEGRKKALVALIGLIDAKSHGLHPYG